MTRRNYEVQVGDEKIAVEVVPGPDGEDWVRLANTEAPANIRALPGAPRDHVLLGARSISVALTPDPDTAPGAFLGQANGEAFSVEVIDPRRRSAGRGQGGGAQSGVMKAAMPGKVVKVLVTEGGSVAKDQPVLVIEAMKMENELRAPRDGVVRQISVSEGDAVETKAPLLVIE